MKKILYPNKKAFANSGAENKAVAEVEPINIQEKEEFEEEIQKAYQHQPNYQVNEIKLSQSQKFSQEQKSEAEVGAKAIAANKAETEADAKTKAYSFKNKVIDIL